MSTRRERLREATREEIKATARQQMREKGTAGLSLRGIAAEMGFSVTAIYRYYDSLDDLITALIVDAFDAQSEAMEQAAAKFPPTRYVDRLLAIMESYRNWALENSTDFQLIYGNPIPGYHAPREITVPKAASGMYLVGQIMADAIDAGQLTVPKDYAQSAAEIDSGLETLPDAPKSILYAVLTARFQMHGFVMLEIHGHNVGTIADADAIYRHLCLTFLSTMGLKSPPTGDRDHERTT
ncbi:MAG: TetR/AcrR family transcriptional regulator [Anaerolineae bacterium]|nr:TetR/AcrR family transcriptional regulator [Anaerolineae bacterium]